ncbi:hypothetical protein SteCoe_15505 [Stentor coeruleus]|uniref:Uncharacterized protein n=1 Tax=Stentor coeruleus TaxID=5963 RepID=A0A1R2C3K0_9CILI|nr:hypothetical protein SteCoe_15505 [Stentor coeruleus]
MAEIQEETQILDSPTREVRFEAKKAWKLLKNVFKASFLLKNHDVQVVADIDQLVEEVRMSPGRSNIGRGKTITDEVIFDHRTTDKLFFHIQRSSTEDLIEIDQLIENDPRRYARNKTDPDSFINKPNINGIRPLYEACKNGYSNTVQLLLDHGANPHLLSYIDLKEPESCLEVACRWNHFIVIKCLMNHSRWSNKEIRDAMKKCCTSRVKEILKGNNSSTRRRCSCFG